MSPATFVMSLARAAAHITNTIGKQQIFLRGCIAILSDCPWGDKLYHKPMNRDQRVFQRSVTESVRSLWQVRLGSSATSIYVQILAY